MSVTALTLYNAVDDVPFFTLNDGATVSYLQTNCWGLTIKAETSGTIGSVRWGFDGNGNYATENYAPYAIAGDVNGSDLVPWAVQSIGTHSVKATAFSGKDGTGTVLGSITRTINIIDQPLPTGPTTPPPVVAGTVVSFSKNVADGAEQGRDTATWTVARSGGSTASALNVTYSLSGSSLNGADYDTLSGTVTIPAGSSTANIVIRPKDDSIVEGTETLFGTLVAGSGYSLGSVTTASAMIFDNDSGGGVSNPPPPVVGKQSISDITWGKTGPRSPEPRTEAGSIQIGSKIYAIGGFTATGGTGTFFPLTRKVHVYDMATRKWTQLASLPSAAAGNHFGVATDGKFIYTVSGQTEATYGRGTNTVYRYDIAANKWSLFSQNLPATRYGGAAFVVNGYLHFVGGDKSDRETISTDHWAVNLANPGAKGWERRASIPLGGDHMSHVEIGGRFYFFGGEHGHHGLGANDDNGYIQHNYTFEYNPANDTWTRKANMPLGLSHIEGSTLAINGKAVLIGGLLTGGGDNTTSRVHVYDPVSNTWKTLATRYPKRIIGSESGYWNGKIYMTDGFSPDTEDRTAGFEGTVKFV